MRRIQYILYQMSHFRMTCLMICCCDDFTRSDEAILRVSGVGGNWGVGRGNMGILWGFQCVFVMF